MALIECLECGKEISDKAELCPNCGALIEKKKKEDLFSIPQGASNYLSTCRAKFILILYNIILPLIILICASIAIYFAYDEIIKNETFSNIVFKMKSNSYWAWYTGFFVSLILGHFFGWTFLRFVRRDVPTEILTRELKRLKKFNKQMDTLLEDDEKKSLEKAYNKYLPQLSPSVVGATERIFFTLFVALGVNVTVIVIGWTGLKMATGWSRAGKSEPDNEDFRIWKANAFTSLFGNLISLSFAVLGGMICRLPLRETSRVWESLPWWL